METGRRFYESFIYCLWYCALDSARVAWGPFAVRLLIGITLLEFLFGKWVRWNLTCAILRTETRSYPLVKRKVARGSVVLMSGRPRCRQAHHEGTTRGSGGSESNLGWDKWRWGLYVGTQWLVSIYPWHDSYFREYENQFESLMLTRCENTKYRTRAT